jgi:hypothetical protein
VYGNRLLECLDKVLPEKQVGKPVMLSKCSILGSYQQLPQLFFLLLPRIIVLFDIQRKLPERIGGFDKGSEDRHDQSGC